MIPSKINSEIARASRIGARRRQERKKKTSQVRELLKLKETKIAKRIEQLGKEGSGENKSHKKQKKAD